METQRQDEDPLIVKVKQGLLCGELKMSAYGTFYMSFRGIPFAAPPLGELRFRDPQPPACWPGIRNVKDSKEGCTQMKIGTRDTFIGSEDCLYLNIYTPYHAVSEKSKSVMIWVHGGGFLIGSGCYTETRPDYFLERDIILVSFNYRLGAFGFLNLNHNAASGNQGLKDQVAALTWVNENITAFGGDPNNITVFGSDTGAVSAHLLILSPLSKGLIHKAILQGGTASMNWMIIGDRPEANAFKLASVLGENSKDPEKVVAFLRTLPAVKIVMAQYEILTSQETRMGKLIFGPTIDQYATHSFLPCSVDILISRGNQIPIIVGYTSQRYFRFPKDIKKKDLYTTYSDLPSYLERLNQDDKKKVKWVNDLLQCICLNYSKVQPPLIQTIRTFLNNIHFDIPIKSFVHHQRKKTQSPIYVYEFSYIGKRKFLVSNSWRHNEYMTGTAIPFDGDELAYLFYMPRYMVENCEALEIRTDDFRMLHSLTTMWTNFAKNGNPTPFIPMYMSTKWLPATKDTSYYLHIDKEIRLLTLQMED